MNKKFDIAIVGGGPAGIFAAIQASEKGSRVALIEKNPFLGKKLLITGNKRCNITQNQNDNKKFVQKLGKKGKFLLSGLSHFNSQDIINFFEKNNLKTKTERGNRVFPKSDKSDHVLNTLKKCLEKNKVNLFLNQKVIGFKKKDNKIISLKLKDQEIVAHSFIFASGGKSYPGTGSTGDGYQWAQKLGHRIIKPRPALTPIQVKEKWPKELAGLTLKNIKISVFQNKKKQDERFGELLFTHFGLSGPIILELSKKIGELKKPVYLNLDFKPALDTTTLDKRLQRDFKKNKNFKNYLPELVPQKIKKIIIENTKINSEKKVNTISKQGRKNLIKTLKGLTITVDKLLGFNQAIVTSGGVDLKEIDSKTMRSKIINNLYFAGEIIDLDGPTGGYNLQICWTTAYLAGKNIK